MCTDLTYYINYKSNLNKLKAQIMMKKILFTVFTLTIVVGLLNSSMVFAVNKELME
jgi:hypothetical protein